LAKDVKLIRHPEGPRLGELAPDFALKDTQGEASQLTDFRDKPVILIIGSGTFPMTQGNLPGLQGVYQDYADRCD
jgi:glutathione peroxidase-family protein